MGYILHTWLELSTINKSNFVSLGGTGFRTDPCSAQHLVVVVVVAVVVAVVVVIVVVVVIRVRVVVVVVIYPTM